MTHKAQSAETYQLVMRRSRELRDRLWLYESNTIVGPRAEVEIENGMQEPLAILKAVFNRRMNVENN